jgi:hypothetical protein
LKTRLSILIGPKPGSIQRASKYMFITKWPRVERNPDNTQIPTDFTEVIANATQISLDLEI